MKRINVLVAGIAFCLVAMSCTENQNDPVAVCENGQFVGYVEDNDVLAFKGIPFAIPRGRTQVESSVACSAFR